MPVSDSLRGAVCAALIVCLAPAAQAQRLDVDALRAYGGTYSTDCAKPDAPKLLANANMISVQRGNQRMDGLKPAAAAGFFGDRPPRNYLMTLLGEVRGSNQLIFVIYQDRQGKYAMLDGDQAVRKQLGTLVGPRYKRC